MPGKPDGKLHGDSTWGRVAQAIGDPTGKVLLVGKLTCQLGCQSHKQSLVQLKASYQSPYLWAYGDRYQIVVVAIET